MPLSTWTRVLAIGLVLIVAAAPLPLASNRDWAWAPISACIGILVLLTLVSRKTSRVDTPALEAELRLTILAVGLVVTWMLIQALLPSDLGAKAAIAASSAEVLRMPISNLIALDTEQALSGTMRLLAYCGVFWLAASFSADPSFPRQLTWGIITSAVVVTGYGLAMQADNGSCVVLGIVKAPIGSSCPFSGTFRNSGNYATFVGLAALTCVSSIQGRVLRTAASSTSFRQRVLTRLAMFSGQGGVLTGALLILLGGLFLSGSKTNAVSFLIASIAMVTLMNIASGRHPRVTLVTVAVLTLFAFTIFLLSGEMLLLRSLQFVTSGDPDRTQLFGLSLDAIRARPLSGWGAGSFQSIFSLLQPANVTFDYDKAHDTYLETFVELGIPVGIAFFLAIALLAGRCLLGTFERKRDLHLPALGFAATLFVALVSFVDFGVQIPAVAILFSALLGMAWRQSRSSRLSHQEL